MSVEIVPSMSYHTYDLNAFGLGIVAMRDKRKAESGWEGDPIFSHKLYESAEYTTLTDEQRAEIKADCDALVKLLEKFYHKDEYVQVKD